jgi:hypothetical protein
MAQARARMNRSTSTVRTRPRAAAVCLPGGTCVSRIRRRRVEPATIYTGSRCSAAVRRASAATDDLQPRGEPAQRASLGAGAAVPARLKLVPEPRAQAPD